MRVANSVVSVPAPQPTSITLHLPAAWKEEEGGDVNGIPSFLPSFFPTRCSFLPSSFLPNRVGDGATQVDPAVREVVDERGARPRARAVDPSAQPGVAEVVDVGVERRGVDAGVRRDRGRVGRGRSRSEEDWSGWDWGWGGSGRGREDRVRVC